MDSYINFGCCHPNWLSVGADVSGKVADGVARLTVRNAGNIVKPITADTACGFESELVKASVSSESWGK